MSSGHRQFLQTSGRSRNEIREVLQSIFAAELLLGSRELWLVSPWITDVEVIQDPAGSFQSLWHDSTQQGIRLAQMLVRLQEQGSNVIVVTRPEESTSFIKTLLTRARASAHPENLRIVERETLHAKGLLGDGYCLSGSMNFTYSGIYRWDEMLSFYTDPAIVSQIRLEFQNEYGG